MIAPTAPLQHPEVAMAEAWGGFFDSLFSHKTETQIWLESDQVSRVCREWEIERLEESGVVIGGLA